MNEKFIVVLITSPRKDSKRISFDILSSHLAACVNILPVHSMYWWKGNLEEDSEDLLIIKTTEKLFEKLKHKVIEIHPYEVPEIMAIPVLAGYEKYLKWLSDSIANLDV